MAKRPLPSLVAVAVTTAALAAQPTLQWVEKPRPFGLRQAAAVWDSARQVAVLFGGETDGNIGVRSAKTWEWDGAAWMQRDPAVRPSGTTSHLMAYDPARRRTVLFDWGFQETWEWDADRWTQLQPTTMPPFPPTLFDEPTMTFDEARGVAVVFDPPSASFWRWDGADWTQLPPAGPPSVYSHLTYDAARQVLVLVNHLGETWEGDGATMTLRTAAGPKYPGLSLTGRGRMAHDRGRGVTVLREQTTGGSQFRTWEWDGNQWTDVSGGPAGGGPPGPAIWYDEVRQTIVMFGRQSSILQPDVRMFEWDGNTWSAIAMATNRPTARHAMAYDSGRQRIVTHAWGVTREWDGNTWTDIATPGFPTGLNALVYDPTRGTVISFGGTTGGGTRHSETWEWDGVTWTQLSPTQSPPARQTAAMVWDSARQVAVMFGGRTIPPFGDTWEWNGSDWTQRTPANNPPADGEPALAYDEARQRTVMFGSAGETWEWDGIDWTRRTPATNPTLRGAPAMAYDAARQRVVMFGGDVNWGGFPSEPTNQTWEWDGVDWTLVASGPTAPQPRMRTAMAYDAARGQVVINGGEVDTGIGTSQFSDTWVFASTWAASTTGYGIGCTGVPGTPRLTGYGRPSVGNTGFEVHLLDAVPNAPAFLLLTAQPAVLINFVPCILSVDPGTFLVSLPATTNGSGYAEFPIPIPFVPAAIGGHFYGQALVADGTGPWRGIWFSHALDVLIGD